MKTKYFAKCPFVYEEQYVDYGFTTVFQQRMDMIKSQIVHNMHEIQRNKFDASMQLTWFEHLDLNDYFTLIRITGKNFINSVNSN